MMTALVAKAQWSFDEETKLTAGDLRYYVDRQAHAAQCIGLVEGLQPTTVTVPATVTLEGSTYRVVSIADGAFLNAKELTEAYLQSPELVMEQLVFGGKIQRLHMAAAVPPELTYYLAVDISTYTFPMVRVYVPKGSRNAYLANEWWAQHAIIDGEEEQQVTVTTTAVGMLKQVINAQGIPLKGVNHLVVSGPLNEDDIRIISDSLTNLFTLDMSQAIIRKLPKEAFSGCRFSSIKLPGTLQDMSGSAFVSCSNLEELVIPEGVLNADNLVSNCPKLRLLDLPSTLLSAKRFLSSYNFNDDGSTYSCTVTCRAFFPPKAGSYAVFTYGNVDIKVRVPAVSASAYASASGWKDLTQETFSEMPTNITVLGQQELNTDDLPSGYSPNIRLSQFGDYGGYGDNDAFGLLTVKGSKALNVGAFTAFTDLHDDRNYTGRYGCELLTETPMTAQSVHLDFVMSEDWWYFLSFPFDVKVSDIVTDKDIRHWVIRSYSGKNRAAMRGEQWIDVPYSSTLEANRGYIWQVSTGNDGEYNRSDLSISVAATANTINNMFAHEDVSIPLSEYASTYEHNASWNLVGNPYPCYYHIGGLKQKMPITVWSGRMWEYDQYRTYSPVDDANKELHPYEAFFLQKPANASALVFGAEGRVAFGSNARAYAPSGFAAGNSNRQVINLTLTANDMEDYTRVVLNHDAKIGYELECDAAKFFSQSEQVPQLYTFIGTEPCAINERPEGDGMVRMGVRTAAATTCVLSMESLVPTDATLPIMLADQLTGTLTDLSREAYTFLSVPGRDDNRFALYVGAAATGILSVVGTQQQTVFPTMNLQGQPVGSDYKGIVIENGKLTIKR